jgi:hypothetical protein
MPAIIASAEGLDAAVYNWNSRNDRHPMVAGVAIIRNMAIPRVPQV